MWLALPEETCKIVISYLSGLCAPLVSVRASSRALKGLSTTSLAATVTVALKRRLAVPELGLKALSRICSTGDQDVASVALSHLTHQNAIVRQLAVTVAARTVQRGDVEAFRGLCPYLEDPNERVQMATMELLLKIAGSQGDEVATRMLLSMLETPGSRLAFCREFCRVAVTTVLVAIAQQGDARVVSVLVRCLNRDPAAAVRRVAAKGLARIAGRGNSIAADALVTATNDSDESVRCFAVSALAHVVARPSEIIAYATKEQRRSAARRGGFIANSVAENPPKRPKTLNKYLPASSQRTRKGSKHR